jgi:hypothetical protein
MIPHAPCRKIKSAALLVALALAPVAAQAPAQAHAAPQFVAAQPAARDGRRDFDFEFGDWTMHLKRLVKPLSGSTEWVEYEGTSVVHKIWGGAANVGEIDISGPAGRIQGMSVRLYNPQTNQWSVTFANARGGALGTAMIGGFKDGRGEFYDQEDFNGRAIFVRFIFSEIEPTSFKLEQAFSGDGGKTWEANWIATFRKAG